MPEQIAEFGGKCAFAVSAGSPARAPYGKTKHVLEKDGRTYIFSAAVPKLLFRVIPGSVARAHRRWDAEKGA